MTERLTINFTPAEGSVIRIVGLIERRGYEILGMTMDGDLSAAMLTVDVNPRDVGRRLPVVAQHLGKLIDVQTVSFDSIPAEAAA